MQAPTTIARPLAAVLALIGALVLLIAPAEPAAAAAQASSCALSGTTGWTDEGHWTDRTRFQQPLGTKRVLTLFVDFPDAPADGPTSTYTAQLTPAADWMWNASYGRTWLAITPLNRWLRMPQYSTSYGFQRGISFEQHEAYVRDAVQAAAPYADFSRYDLVYVVPPRSAPAISFTPTYVYDPGTAGVTANGTRIKWAVTFGQDMWYWGPRIADHETGHTFGLPDLYAFTGTDQHAYVGGWDVMGKVGGPAPQYVGWEGWKLGWIDDSQVACLPGPGWTTVDLNAVEYTGGTKIAVIRTSDTTAYVAESRRAAYADPNPCSTGVLIYKVDTAVQTGYGPIRVINGNPGTTPPSGCTSLDMAAHHPGQSFTDWTARVQISIRSGGQYGDTIQISKW
ncbi:M6 family metalloprotease domain-containing protein [Kitasatospora atroaurantiaca]|uniref:M6 family metalloprotease-like protein n=1 Tax=Kitasatospora atroaurantiaca TaxID=285545 RepID=A0A561F149_9ACTN|nr:M6 family metalloprotease-like protein [Kitasatospora atroaurantiaca]